MERWDTATSSDPPIPRWDRSTRFARGNWWKWNLARNPFPRAFFRKFTTQIKGFMIFFLVFWISCESNSDPILAMLSPLIHPTLVIINETGGLSLLIEKTLKHLFKNILGLKEKDRRKTTFQQHKSLFGQEHFHSVKNEIVKITKSTTGKVWKLSKMNYTFYSLVHRIYHI